MIQELKYVYPVESVNAEFYSSVGFLPPLRFFFLFSLLKKLIERSVGKPLESFTASAPVISRCAEKKNEMT